MHAASLKAAILSLLSIALIATGCSSRASTSASPRVVTVAQSGSADVIGSDSAALQKAASLLRPGDTLFIGPGIYAMDNSLFVPSGVNVKGAAGQTILRKSRGVESALLEDGDFADSFLAVADPQKFHPGMGVAVSDDTLHSCWDPTVTSVASVKPPYVLLSPVTVRDYSREKHALLSNTFPVVAVMNAQNSVVEDLIVDGNRAENRYLDGCRGGAIYLYNVRDVKIRHCTAKNYNGDGISFQVTENVEVLDSESYGHAGFGVHPGTGSAHALVKNCRLHDNGAIGLFLCWRVRHSRFENNVMEHNGQYGISIGHKDTDNEFIGNTIARNGATGVYFRKETASNSGSRNVFRNNRVLQNGNAQAGYGFYVEPNTSGLVFEGNQIAESSGVQKVAIYKAPAAAN